MHNLIPLHSTAIWALLAIAFLGSAYAFLLRSMILRQEKGTDEMQTAWALIKTGTHAYLGQQFRALLLAIVLLAVIVAGAGWSTPVSSAAIEQFGSDTAMLWVVAGRVGAFLVGALLSYATGFLGASAAVEASVRLTAASRKGYNPALQAGYRPGAFTGLLTAGLGLLGVVVIFIIYGAIAPDVLIGFALGSSLTALFLRVGGGIYSQSAESGAARLAHVEELAPKPKDDQRSIAADAGLAGRNAGSATGIAADVFESGELLTVAALVLGLALGDMRFVIFPLLLRGLGILATFLGTLAVGTDERKRNALAAMNRGFLAATAVGLIGLAAITYFFMVDPTSGVVDWRPLLSVLVGLVLVVLLERITGYFTATTYTPVKEMSRVSRDSPSTSILSGLSLGFESSVWSALIIALALLSSAGIYANEPDATRLTAVLYGVSLTGLGMLTLAGSTIAINTFGAVAERARHIGQSAGLDKNARNVTNDLYAIGNTTRTVTRGTATGLSVIAVVALFGALLMVVTQVQDEAGLPPLTGINLASLHVFGGLLIGSTVPLLLSALALRGVSRTAAHMVNTVQQQRNPSATATEQASADYAPDYASVVRSTTVAAQQELRSLGLIAFLLPMLLGLLLGIDVLAGFLAGVILSAQLMALFQSNAGGAWTNARTYIEDGHFGGKHSDAHLNAIVGDEVGEPLQNASGIAMPPFMKIMAVVSLLLAPVLIDLRPPGEPPGVGVMIPVVICAFGLVWALWSGKREVPAAPVERERSKAVSTKERF